MGKSLARLMLKCFYLVEFVDSLPDNTEVDDFVRFRCLFKEVLDEFLRVGLYMLNDNF